MSADAVSSGADAPDAAPDAAPNVVPNIVLIGPVGAGKSTQGELLAEALGRPRRAMDELRWDFYREIGYSDEAAREVGEREGFVGVSRYWKPFEAYAVERLLSQSRGCVIDLGAGHSVFEDPALLGRVRAALRRDDGAGESVVVLLLPSPDPAESVRLLREGKWDGVDGGFDFHDHFVRHPSNGDLARFVVYTQGKTPAQTRDEILALLR